MINEGLEGGRIEPKYDHPWWKTPDLTNESENDQIHEMVWLMRGVTTRDFKRLPKLM